ncbi:ubiquitin-associated protein 1 [Elysia marginata]|uniref:Ubiquitin-associated protein 1 n=1 Tax=Elysia marginata TaxID=1093978 RepID=A0AAV4G720_9GAST|nr:ubiquitin-associated protein 1 [Elysia marginata]
MERTYGSLVRHELGSSYSALDGVPFKIGRAFRRPEPVSPPQLSRTKTASVSSQEYTFEVEEAVLTWAKACDEAVQKAAEQQAQRLKQNENHKTETEQSQTTTKENGDGISCHADPDEISVYDVPRYLVPQKKNGDNQVKPLLPPKVSSLSTKPVPSAGTVLTPVPIKPNVPSSTDKRKSSTAGPNSKVGSELDLAMFEAEVDPFDNLELQALDDMEELKVVLNSNSVNSHSDLSNAETPVTVEGSDDNINQSKQNTQSDTDLNAEDEFSKEKNSVGTCQLSETSLETCDDGEYVEITPKYKNHSEIPHSAIDVSTGESAAFHKPSPAAGGTFPASSINRQIYKPVLPPIPKSAQSDDLSAGQAVSVQPSTAAHLANASHDVTHQVWNSSILSPRETGKVEPIKQCNVSPSPPLSGLSIKPSRPAPPPPVSAKPVPVPRTRTSLQSPGMMSSSTGPSLAMFLGNTGQPEVRNTPSLYSRHCNSTSDLIAGSTINGADSPRRNSAAVSPQVTKAFIVQLII